jgi:hypothetical protein
MKRNFLRTAVANALLTMMAYSPAGHCGIFDSHFVAVNDEPSQTNEEIIDAQIAPLVELILKRFPFPLSYPLRTLVCVI